MSIGTAVTFIIPGNVSNEFQGVITDILTMPQGTFYEILFLRSDNEPDYIQVPSGLVSAQ